MRPHARYQSPDGPRRSLRTGFTIVELIIATVVLSVGLLALTGGGIAIVRLENRGYRLSEMAAAGETRLELLRAEHCSATSGSSDGGQLLEHWAVTPISGGAREIVDSVGEAGMASGGAAAERVFRSAARC